MGDNTYSEGEQLRLTCSSEGGPGLEYTWSLDDVPIPNNNSDVLVINNVNTTHGGEYTCNVTNEAGADNDTITVYSKFTIYSKPYHICT